MPDLQTAIRPHAGRRIVLTTFGSLGDLHPYLALALELRARGHDPVIATSEFYRQKIIAAGIGFAPVRPDRTLIDNDPRLLDQLLDLRRGPETMIRQILMPHLRDSYTDLAAAAAGADLVVSHCLTFAAPLVAERLGIAWASTVLAPSAFFSVYDPPVLAPAPFLSRLRFLGPAVYGPLFRRLCHRVHPWCEPWRRLRAELGLPPAGNPVFSGQHSPHCVLALYSAVLGAPQPDWPPHAAVTGFTFYDHDGSGGLEPGLEQFLDAGEPPLVFTLGSAAVMHPGAFYAQSAAAAALLGRRAVLLVGRDQRHWPAGLPPHVAAFEYAPYSALFPRACAIVHSGGIGTTAQALRAGRPMLVVPYAFDQPDNAERVVRLKIARSVSRHRYTPARAARELQYILGDPQYASRAAGVASRLEGECGAAAACLHLEALLA